MLIFVCVCSNFFTKELAIMLECKVGQSPEGIALRSCGSVALCCHSLVQFCWGKMYVLKRKIYWTGTVKISRNGHNYSPYTTVLDGSLSLSLFLSVSILCIYI